MVKLLVMTNKSKQYAKENVTQTYDKISNWFENHRSLELFEKPYLDSLIKLDIFPNKTLMWHSIKG